MNDTSATGTVRNRNRRTIGAAVMALALAAALLFIGLSTEGAPGWFRSAIGVAFLFAVTTGCVIVSQRLRGKSATCAPMRPPVRRYLWRFMPAMLTYVVALFASLRIYRTYDLAEPLLWLVAIAPALPIIAAIGAIGLYLKEEDDEFQRALAVRSYVLATGLMLAVATIWGFLEQFGLAPHIPAWSAFPLLAICLVPSQAIVYWRYR